MDLIRSSIIPAKHPYGLSYFPENYPLAKDGYAALAPALFARGEEYEPFQDLGDVIRILEDLGF